MATKKFKKGIASFLTIMLISVLLAMVLGITPILISQIKKISAREDSTIAFYAADTGIERVVEAIDVGYDYYQYPSNGSCDCAETKIIEVCSPPAEEGGEEECTTEVVCVRYECNYSACQPVIRTNDTYNCGLPSKCQNDSDCLCPVDKCIGANYYDYPSRGKCSGGKCIECTPSVSANACGTSGCSGEGANDECPCPENYCQGLELSAVPSPSWKTPYFDNFTNGANYQTYIEKASGKSLIKSVGTYRETKRAIEFSH